MNKNFNLKEDLPIICAAVAYEAVMIPVLAVATPISFTKGVIEDVTNGESIVSAVRDNTENTFNEWYRLLKNGI